METRTDTQISMERKASEIMEQGMQQLDKALIGQLAAKAGVITSLVTGEALSLASVSGTGKTVLSENAHRLIIDLNPEEVAVIPGNSEITSKHVFGSEMDTSETSVRSSGYVDENTRLLILSELTRLNPNTAGSMNDLIEHNQFSRIGSKTKKILDIITMISAYNPNDRGDDVFPLTDAMKSRFGMGAPMELPSTKNREQIYNKDWQGSVESIESVLSLNDINELRSHLNETKLNQTEISKLLKITDSLREKLQSDKFRWYEGLRLENSMLRLALFFKLANDGNWDKISFLEAKDQSLSAGLLAARYVVLPRIVQTGYATINSLPPEVLVEDFMKDIKE